MFGKGISRSGDILDLAASIDVIKKSGAWFYLGEERMGQGRENAKQFLLERPETAEKLEADIRDAIKQSREQARQERQQRSEQRKTQLKNQMGSTEDREEDDDELDDLPMQEDAPAPKRRSAAVSIDADDFGDDDI